MVRLQASEHRTFELLIGLTFPLVDPSIVGDLLWLREWNCSSCYLPDLTWSLLCSMLLLMLTHQNWLQHLLPVVLSERKFTDLRCPFLHFPSYIRSLFQIIWSNNWFEVEPFPHLQLACLCLQRIIYIYLTSFSLPFFVLAKFYLPLVSKSTLVQCLLAYSRNVTYF